MGYCSFFLFGIEGSPFDRGEALGIIVSDFLTQIGCGITYPSEKFFVKLLLLDSHYQIADGLWRFLAGVLQ